MVNSTASRPSFGQAIGTLARKINKLHRSALAEFNTDFPTWMLFTLLNEKAAPVPIKDIITALDHRMDLDKPGVLATLERAATAGFISYKPDSPAPTAELTKAGSTHFATIYTHARTITDAVTTGLDPDKLETTITTLLEANTKATPLLQEHTRTDTPTAGPPTNAD